MKLISLFILTIMIFVLCPATVFADEVSLSAEDAYSKALEVLMDMDAIPSFRDKELLMIKTDPIPMKLSAENCDCGKMFGIPYIKDKRVKTAVTYQIRVKKIDDSKSDVKVKTTVDGYMAKNEGAFFMPQERDKNKALSCKSTGVLEKKFIELLKM